MRKTSRHVTHRARTRTATFIAMIAATALLAQPAWATTPTEGSGTFTFTAAVTSSRQADGNTFLTLTGTEAIAGAITGAATVQFDQVIHPSGEANLKGLVTCACSVGGRSGTVAFRFEGSGAGTASSPLVGQFVTQSASGGLAGLRFDGTFHSVGLGGTYTVRWHFDP